MSLASEQLADELSDRCLRLCQLLGLDLADLLTARARTAADTVASALDMVGQAADPTNAAQAANVLFDVLFGDGDPPLHWWRSAAGRLVAGVIATQWVPGDEEAATWSRAEVAEVLGVHPGTVAQMVARGALPQGAGGGVLRGPVLARLVRAQEPQRQAKN